MRQASEKIGKAASKVGESVNKQWKEASETEFAKDTQERLRKAAEHINKNTEPIRKNEYVGKLGESFRTVVKDDSGRYTGFVDKETRRKMREEAAKQTEQGPSKRVAENPDAGASMVMHKDSKWKESWNKFKEDSPIMQGIFRARKNYEESDNIFVSYSRAFTDRISETFGK